MVTLLALARLAQLAATVLAVLLGRHVARHSPVAVYLVAVGLLGALHTALKSWVVVPAVITAGGSETTYGAPLVGWERIAAHVDHAAVLGLWAALAMVAAAVFPPLICGACGHRREMHFEDGCFDANRQCRCPRNLYGSRSQWTMAAPVLAWAAIVSLFGASYPATRHLQPQSYLLAGLLALGTGWAAFVGWYRRRDPREGFPLPQKCVLWMLIFGALELVASHLVPGFFPRAVEDPRSVVRVLLYGAVMAMEGGALWTRR